MSKPATASRVDVNLIKHNAIYLRFSQIRNLMDNCICPDSRYELKFAAFMHLIRFFHDLEKDGVLKMGDTDAEIENFLTDAEMVSAFTEAFGNS